MIGLGGLYEGYVYSFFDVCCGSGVSLIIWAKVMMYIYIIQTFNYGLWMLRC